jgi:hypothetical protein
MSGITCPHCGKPLVEITGGRAKGRLGHRRGEAALCPGAEGKAPAPPSDDLLGALEASIQRARADREDAAEETQAILDDPDTMAALAEAEEDIAAGRFVDVRATVAWLNERNGQISKRRICYTCPGDTCDHGWVELVKR